MFIYDRPCKSMFICDRPCKSMFIYDRPCKSLMFDSIWVHICWYLISATCIFRAIYFIYHINIYWKWKHTWCRKSEYTRHVALNNLYWMYFYNCFFGLLPWTKYYHGIVQTKPNRTEHTFDFKPYSFKIA